MITFMITKPEHLYLIIYVYFIGSAAFRGAAGDCE